MTDKISVIVPVYNCEATLRQTADAILSSTRGGIELILVDDGSTDGSLAVIESIVKSDERAVFLHKENGGPSSARNEGIRLASGKYIAFCDADDLPHPDMYSRLYERLCRDGSDLALCDIFSERDGRPLGFPWEGDRLFEDGEINTLIACMIGNENDDVGESPVWGSVCRGLYRADTIKKHGLEFPTDISFAEDLVFSLRYLRHSKRVSVINEPLYTYRDRRGSIMNSYYSYKPDMLSERVRLVNYLSDGITGLDGYDGLRDRLFVTARCYYHECVGNACRGTEGRGRRECLSELSEILKSPDVKRAFQRVSHPTGRKRIIYFLIRLRLGRILYFYYKRRFRNYEC